ncbi:hypothetical protein O6H91_04G107600 [Diphasiastrum complanatum]|uniref:Uncharacterized protein n=1 Tax=Diphasiastrum complanatum TaxID=34168 RepID=A0ACC2E026_DIPCM|nr:hypothetical protein O6H91_04G107600 [Diphasiastrum complanatum]
MEWFIRLTQYVISVYVFMWKHNVSHQLNILDMSMLITFVTDKIHDKVGQPIGSSCSTAERPMIVAIIKLGPKAYGYHVSICVKGSKNVVKPIENEAMKHDECMRDSIPVHGRHCVACNVIAHVVYQWPL